MRNQAPATGSIKHQWHAGLQLPSRFALNSSATRELGKTQMLIPREGSPTGDWSAPDQLVQGVDGRLYGMNHYTLFRLQPDGSGFSILKQLVVSGTHQNYFIGRPAVSGNTIYGTTSTGVGLNGSLVTVFKMNTDGTSYTVLKTNVLIPQTVSEPGVVLSGETLYGWGFKISTDGTGCMQQAGFPPWDGLQDWHLEIQVSGNHIFGATARDGQYGAGTVFRLDTDGTGYTVLRNFTTEEASNINAYLTLVGDTLYGASFPGLGFGKLFKVNTDGTGYSVLMEFPFGPPNELQYFGGGALMYSGGKFYAAGGFGPLIPGALRMTVFSMGLDGTGYTVLKHFIQGNDPDPASQGYFRVNILTVAGDAIYGMAQSPQGFAGGDGLDGRGGALFKMNTDGSGFEVLREFSEPNLFPDGHHPGPVAVSDGVLYGLDHTGNGKIRVFKINIDGTDFTSLLGSESIDYPFQPWLGLTVSGSTLFGVGDGRGVLGTNVAPDISVGTIFRMNTDGTDFSVLKEFIWPAEEGPIARLALSGSTLYGTVGWLQIRGGIDIDSGKVFKLNTDGTGYAVLHAFTLPNIDTISGMWTNSDGLIGGRESELTVSGSTLYGTAFGGGQFGYGTVFKLNTDGTGFAVLRHLSYQQADNPASRLLLSGDKLFGTSGFSGNGSDAGSVFRLNTDGTGFTILKQFSELLGDTNSDGAIPLLGGIWGNTLYGTTIAGGNFGRGTVFKINTNGTGFAVIAHIGNNEHQGNGNLFQHSLVQWGNTLFGSAEAGGDQRIGTIYRVDLEPTLSIGRAGPDSIAVSWPSVWTDYVLQQNTNGLSSVNWSNVTATIQNDGTNKTLVVNPTDESRFYRLQK